MKKLMILGGSENQLPLIKSAKSMNITVVLCDYSKDNIGREYADIFHQISTLDKEAVLAVAKKEGIDGIVTNSEPAMPIASYVGNKLNLPSNPYKSIITLSRKDLFRKFLRENGFNSPQSYKTDNYENALKNISKFNFPLMVKPIDSSGSRGVGRIEKTDQLEDAFNTALKNSKSKNVIIEEYIERTHDYMIGGDIFVSNGEVIFWGLMNSMRNKKVSEFVPTGTSYPTFITSDQEKVLKKEVTEILKKLDIQQGPFNLEIMFNKNNELYAIEINPRSGGNKIPEILKVATGVDLVGLNIQSSLERNGLEIPKQLHEKCVSTYVLHAYKDGTFEGVSYAEEIKNNIVAIDLEKETGDSVKEFHSAEELLGVVFLEFENLSEMQYKMEQIERLITINIDR